MMKAISKKEVIDFFENKLNIEGYWCDYSGGYIIEAKTTNVEGYNGFFLELKFDSMDNFKNIGIWE